MSGGGDPLVGATIAGRYRIVSLIARGGMGKVYKAEQSTLGRICALKVVAPGEQAEGDPEFFKRFSREASTAARLTHPSSVTLFDYGKDEALGLYFIAMEYLDGRTLHRVIHEEAPLSEARAARIARQICRSLAEAHGLGLVHRDLKPSNVLLVRSRGEEDEHVKVLDFGLVKDITAQGEDLTQTGTFMGSPRYTAPEQVMGGEITPRADIYSLGVVLYEMLCGKPPFEKRVSTATLMAHVNEMPPPLHRRNPDVAVSVSPEMEGIVMRCLEKSPERRFGSMRELLGALKAAVSQGEGADRSSVVPEHGSRSSRLSLSGPISAPLSTGSEPHSMPASSGPLSTNSGEHAVSSGPLPPSSGAHSVSSSSGAHPAVGAPAAAEGSSPPSTSAISGAPAAAAGRRSWPTLAVAIGAAALGGVGALLFAQRGNPKEAAGSTRIEAASVPMAAPAAASVVANPAAGIRLVRIESEPPGARVTDRGVEVCMATPCRIVLQGEGVHAEYRLRLTRYGYKPADLLVRPEDETASIPLEPALAYEARSAAVGSPEGGSPEGGASAAADAPAVPLSAAEARGALPAEGSLRAADGPAPAAAAAAEAPAPAAAAAKASAAVEAPAVMHFQEGMSRPVPVAAPSPVYTREALAARVSGTVIAKCVITPAGALTGCRIIKGVPHMNESVLAALAASRYRPVTYQGRPVAVDYVFNIRLVPP